MKIPDDFDFTRRRVEQNEELEAVAWAENNGWECRKLQWQGRAGAPDRAFFGYGHIVLIEMKKPNQRNRKDGGLSKSQIQEHRKLAAVGVKVPICYTKDEAIAVLKRYMDKS